MNETGRPGGQPRPNPWGPPREAPAAEPRPAPAAPAGDGVLFHAVRPMGADLASWGLICALTLPLLWIEPSTWVAANASGLVFAWIANRRFRFELGAEGLRMRAGLIAGYRTWSYAEIAAVEAVGIDGRPASRAPGASGFLRMRMRDGRTVTAVLRDPADAQDAVRLLASRAAKGGRAA